MHKAMGAPANPSSVHSFGRNARLTVEAARESVAVLAGSRPADVVFTSGGTEANNLALAGFDHIVTSVIEHDSVLDCAVNASTINVTPDGMIDLDHAREVLAELTDEQRVAMINKMAKNSGFLNKYDN